MRGTTAQRDVRSGFEESASNDETKAARAAREDDILAVEEEGVGPLRDDFAAGRRSRSQRGRTERYLKFRGHNGVPVTITRRF
jgi:hypothetical protein